MQLPKELEESMRSLIATISPDAKATQQNIIMWGSCFGALWFLLIVLKMSQTSRSSWMVRLCTANILVIMFNILAIKYSKSFTSKYVSYNSVCYPVIFMCVIDTAVFLLYFVEVVVSTLNGIIWSTIKILVKIAFYVGMTWASLVYGFMIYDSLKK